MLDYIAGLSVGLVGLYFLIVWIGKKDDERRALELADEEDSIPDDTCMCGDAMKNHDSPLNCGHSPVSMRAHYLRTK